MITQITLDYRHCKAYESNKTRFARIEAKEAGAYLTKLGNLLTWIESNMNATEEQIRAAIFEYMGFPKANETIKTKTKKIIHIPYLYIHIQN